MLKPLTLPPPLPRPRATLTVGDHIDCALAGSAIRIDLWGMVLDGRVSAYVQPADALRFAAELGRLAHQVDSGT